MHIDSPLTPDTISSSYRHLFVRSNYRFFLLYCCLWSINVSRLLTIIISITNYYYYIINKLFELFLNFIFLISYVIISFSNFVQLCMHVLEVSCFFLLCPQLAKNFGLNCSNPSFTWTEIWTWIINPIWSKLWTWTQSNRTELIRFGFAFSTQLGSILQLH